MSDIFVPNIRISTTAAVSFSLSVAAYRALSTLGISSDVLPLVTTPLTFWASLEPPSRRRSPLVASVGYRLREKDGRYFMTSLENNYGIFPVFSGVPQNVIPVFLAIPECRMWPVPVYMGTGIVSVRYIRTLSLIHI